MLPWLWQTWGTGAIGALIVFRFLDSHSTSCMDLALRSKWLFNWGLPRCTAFLREEEYVFPAWKQAWPWTMTISNRSYRSSNGWFSILMFVFGYMSPSLKLTTSTASLALKIGRNCTKRKWNHLNQPLNFRWFDVARPETNGFFSCGVPNSPDTRK